MTSQLLPHILTSDKSFRQAVSDSNQKEGRILYKNELGGCIRRKKSLRKPHKNGNVPEFSKFSDVYFRESFGYLAELSKLLTERIALIKSKRFIFQV